MSTPPPPSRAVAQLAEDIGRALLRFADTLREDVAEPAATRRPEGRAHGRLQERVLGLKGLDGEHGLASSEVAEQLEVPQSNATRALNALAERGDLVAVPGERPSRWRSSRA
jgi:DNA-binding MarR family transcriptional regulator